MTREDLKRSARQLERLMDKRTPGEWYLDEQHAKRKTMIECTLEVAIIKCDESGGEYWSRLNPDLRYTTDDMGQPVSVRGKTPATFYAERYREDWIYEPPKESAFQKWNKTQAGNMPVHPIAQSDCKRMRKEGWNAAIDTIISDSQTCILPSEYRKLKELREP